MLIICFILMYVMILYILPKKSYKICFFITSLILAIIAFNIEPGTRVDLYRYFEILDNTRIRGWEYISRHPDFVDLPISALYFYFMSLLKVNNFMPAISVFIQYFLVLMMMYNINKKYNFSKIGLFIVTCAFLAINSFSSASLGIRNPLAITIFIFGLYLDFIEKKNKIICFMIYIIACFMHPSIFILLLIRILVLFYNNATKRVFCTVLLLWSFLKNMIIFILSKFSQFSIIQLIVYKMNSYDIGEANAVANVKLYTFVYITLNVILLLTFLYYKKIYKKNNDNEFETYNNYLNLIFCFVFGSITEYHFFIRMSKMTLILTLLPMMYINTKEKNINRYNSYENRAIDCAIFIESFLFLVFYFIGQYQQITF